MWNSSDGCERDRRTRDSKQTSSRVEQPILTICYLLVENDESLAGISPKSAILMSLNLEQRHFIKIHFDEGEKPLQIHRALQEHYGQEALSQAAVYYWIAQLKTGRIDLHNIPSPGRTPDEGIAPAVERAHREDPLLSATAIAGKLKIDVKTVIHYLRNLDMRSDS
jgi:hypothetical protein